MGPGFKYHVVTVAAIFFALTIGLVVGSLSVSPQVVRSQSNLLKALNTKVNQDIKERELQLDRLRKCLAAIMPHAISGKLIGRSVAILLVGDYPDDSSAVRDVLENAGARVATTLTIDRSFARPDQLLESKLAALHADDPRIPRDRAGLVSLIAGALRRGDATGEPLWTALGRADLVRGDSAEGVHMGVTDVVVMGGSRNDSSERTGNVDQPLINALQKQGINVVMCEPEHAAVSDVPAYHALNIDVGTVDNIDDDIGRCALIYVLLGAKDDYGVKGTAKDLLPAMSSGSH